jgi:hypothetical protein
MAVLVEGISVVVRRDAIAQRMAGGWPGFVDLVPNQTLCTDGVLARVGFMAPVDVRVFFELLESNGLRFVGENGRCVDLVVIDAEWGPTVPCDWADVYWVRGDDGGSIVACALRGSRTGDVMCPAGWRYENSLTASHTWTPIEHAHEELELLDHEPGGPEVYWDKREHREVYTGRTTRVQGFAPAPDQEAHTSTE